MIATATDLLADLLVVGNQSYVAEEEPAPPVPPSGSLPRKKRQAAYRVYESEVTRYQAAKAAYDARTLQIQRREHLPPWATFFAQLGALLTRSSGEPVTVGVTTPDRRYAAVLAATGAVLDRCTKRDWAAPSALQAHIRRLRAAERNTPVRHIGATKISDGLWKGIEILYGRELLCIELRNEVRKLPLTQALAVQIVDRHDTETLGSKTLNVPDLAVGMLGPDKALELVVNSADTCLLVGTVSYLEHEFQDETVYLDGGYEQPLAGCFQDLARVREFRGARENYWCRVVSARSDLAEADCEATPQIVIFDDPGGYRRWRHLWPRANQLVIIDRSRASAEAYAHDFNGEFIARRSDCSLLADLSVPMSLEVSAFTRGAP